MSEWTYSWFVRTLMLFGKLASSTWAKDHFCNDLSPLRSPSDWAKESFKVAKDDAYGQLSEPSARGTYRLTDEYVTPPLRNVAQQLSSAGARLAFVLKKALGRH